jgi:ribosomal protein L11 methyltransferase
MDYYEVNITNFTGFDQEIVIAQMADLGFESFSESESGIQGFIREDDYVEEPIIQYLNKVSNEHGLQYSVRKIPAQNWNALWESEYEPVTISGRCRVRAPFHAADPGMQYEIVIEPRMSFGTAHHETTSLMLKLLMLEEVQGKRLLDMGCGTAVLAILADKMHAAEVIAIDNDEWAYSNSIDNLEKNSTSVVTVIQGEAGSIPMPHYDIIIANINRNVLLNDIPIYAGFLKQNGTLLMSGFYEQDLDMIKAAASQSGLEYVSHQADNQWVGAKFKK